MLDDEIDFLRSVGAHASADLIANFGGHVPTARGLRDLARARVRPNEQKYREANRHKRRGCDAKWREDRRQQFDEARLSRPFVVIDSEGQNYDGDDQIVKTQHGDVLYKEHGTYLWCASTDDAGKPPHVLTDPETNGADKRKLGVKTILDWLLSLPRKYDPLRITARNRMGLSSSCSEAGTTLPKSLIKHR